MQSCEFAMTVTALACNIAKGKTSEEIALYAALFSQLGDTLATIDAHQVLCSPPERKETPENKEAQESSPKKSTSGQSVS
ncbi:DUF6774 domain-containing protein [Clostridium transplantifaecale]|uniref:DUF6774 domain-containing protein n=1 Tax=Clostridium transplantifaecale TaxID=2479838 RepID=UPI000F636DA1|nr:DUF6774 domain-containing protein [Clostridium transplantifaecale]